MKITKDTIILFWPMIQRVFNARMVDISQKQALAIFDDFQSISFDKPPTPNIDGINFNEVDIIGGSPDIKRWPITTSIQRIELSNQGVRIDFDKKNIWPNVTPPGWTGGIQYTLWVFLFIENQWYTTGCIEYWKDLDYQGGDMSNAGHQMKINWYYHADPMAKHEPEVGEEIGFMVASGDERRKDVHQTQERSNIVKFPLYNAPHVYQF